VRDKVPKKYFLFASPNSSFQTLPSGPVPTIQHSDCSSSFACANAYLAPFQQEITLVMTNWLPGGVGKFCSSLYFRCDKPTYEKICCFCFENAVWLRLLPSRSYSAICGRAVSPTKGSEASHAFVQCSQRFVNFATVWLKSSLKGLRACTPQAPPTKDATAPGNLETNTWHKLRDFAKTDFKWSSLSDKISPDLLIAVKLQQSLSPLPIFAPPKTDRNKQSAGWALPYSSSASRTIDKRAE